MHPNRNSSLALCHSADQQNSKSTRSCVDGTSSFLKYRVATSSASRQQTEQQVQETVCKHCTSISNVSVRPKHYDDTHTPSFAQESIAEFIDHSRSITEQLHHQHQQHICSQAFTSQGCSLLGAASQHCSQYAVVGIHNRRRSFCIMAETAASCAEQQQSQDANPPSAGDASPRAPHNIEAESSQNVIEQQQQDATVQFKHMQHSWQKLSSSLAELDSTSDLLVQLLHNSRQHIQTHHLPPPKDLQQRGSTSSSADALQPCNQPDTCSSDTSNSSTAVDDLQQQLSALLAEKHRIEADRQDMALQQGKYKGTIAQVCCCTHQPLITRSQCWQAVCCCDLLATKHTMQLPDTLPCLCAAGGCACIQ